MGSRPLLTELVDGEQAWNRRPEPAVASTYLWEIADMSTGYNVQNPDDIARTSRSGREGDWPGDMVQASHSGTDHNWMETTLRSVAESLEDYARENPLPFAAWAFGIGFILGWKLKPW